MKAAVAVCQRSFRGASHVRERQKELESMHKDARLSGRALETFQRALVASEARRSQNIQRTLTGLLSALLRVGHIDAMPTNDPDLWPEETRTEIARQRRSTKQAEQVRLESERTHRIQQDLED